RDAFYLRKADGDDRIGCLAAHLCFPLIDVAGDNAKTNRSTFAAASPTPDLLCLSISASKSRARAWPSLPRASAPSMNLSKASPLYFQRSLLTAGERGPSLTTSPTSPSQMPSQVTARNSAE